MAENDLLARLRKLLDSLHHLDGDAERERAALIEVLDATAPIEPSCGAGPLIAPNGHEIEGTLETLTGVAQLTDLRRTADGTIHFEYVGETKIWWDEQKTVTRDGLGVFVDTQGQEWTRDQLVLAETLDGEG